MILAAFSAAAPTVGFQAPSTGYLYQLVRHWGASDLVARTVQFILVRPVEILVIAGVAWMAGRLGARIARRVAAPMGRHMARASSRAPQRLETFAQTLASLWKAVVWVIALLTILGTIGIDLTPLVAGATVIGAALAFGAQRIVLDILSGFFLLVEDQFGIGDTVSMGDTTGVVEEFHLRVTRLRGADGTAWYVPNGEIRVLGNKSEPGFAPASDEGE